MGGWRGGEGVTYGEVPGQFKGTRQETSVAQVTLRDAAVSLKPYISRSEIALTL